VAWGAVIAAWMGWLASPAQGAAESDSVLEGWLAASSNLTSFQATVVQTRHLKAFTQPLVSTGRVWFANPGRFRWELGNPTQSIALRSEDSLVVLSPRLLRAERHAVGTGTRGPAKELMELLDVGFPRDAREFKTRFDLVEVSTNLSAWVLRMRPRSSMARRMMPQLSVDLEASTLALRATELTFADGSRLRSDFSDIVTNAPLSAELFRTNLDARWKISGTGGTP
jgi:outer membrane lipoprotein-sorting protein